MTTLFDQLRRAIYPRAGKARGDGTPPRVSSIIFGMLLLIFAVGLIAKALTHLFTAT